MARQRRPGRGCPRRRPRRRGRRALGAGRLGRPPALRFPTRLWLPCASSGHGFQAIALRGPDQLREGWSTRRAGRGAGEPGGAGEGAPAAADPDASRSDASAPFPGSAEERRFGPDGPGAWGAADRRPAPSRASGRGRPRSTALARRFPTPRPASKAASGAALGAVQEGLRAGFAAFGMAFGRAFEIMSDNVRLSDIATRRQAGRITAQTAVTKRRRRIHHARVIRADLDLLADRLRTLADRVPAPSAKQARAKTARRKPRNGKPFRRRRRSRLGRGRAEGQGRAIPCLPPAPGSLCSTPSCAPTRPPQARCAPAWRCRAPRLPPRSCASTPTQPRCATCASPSATIPGPSARLSRFGATVASRPAQPRPGPDPRRGGGAVRPRSAAKGQFRPVLAS